MTGKPIRKYSFLIICASLALVTLAAHRPVLSAKALFFDDELYLTENPLVLNPAWTSVKKFFTEVLNPSTVPGYYQPLTMVSLMLDVAAGGSPQNLRPFHITSLALHIANSLLIFAFIYLLFGKRVPAAFVAAIFALHPLTVEPVAWLAERKTLLAAFFALSSLIFYLNYTRKRGRLYYSLCLVTFALSLLSKPSAIALPVLLLLLDYWPLRRLTRRVLTEKIPLFALALVAGVITFLSQQRTAGLTVAGINRILTVILIVCHNIVFYLAKFLLPLDLAAYYPFAEPFDLANPFVLFCLVAVPVLIFLLLFSLRLTRSVFVGFLFFLVAIFPVMGLISVHGAIAADRHIYFPMLGLLLPIASLFCLLTSAKPVSLNLSDRLRRALLFVIVLVIGVPFFVLTRSYLSRWQSTLGLYEHLLARSPNVAVLHSDYALALIKEGKTDQALDHFHSALGLAPESADVHTNLANLLSGLGRFDAALIHAQKAIELNPRSSAAHANLAAILVTQTRFAEAEDHCRQALGLNPYNLRALSTLGLALANQGKFDLAVGAYTRALSLQPGDIITHGRLALALANSGKPDQAIHHCRIVLAANPDDLEMLCNLGILLEQTAEIDQAIVSYRRALQIDPDYQGAAQLLKAAVEKKSQPDNLSADE